MPKAINAGRDNRLRLYRKQSGLSQREVARLLGLDTSAPVSRYECGAKLPSLISALKLEIIYHTPAAFLFEGLYQRLRGEIELRRGKGR